MYPLRKKQQRTDSLIKIYITFPLLKRNKPSDILLPCQHLTMSTLQVGILCICMSTSIQTIALLFQIKDFMEPAESKVLTLVRLREEQQQGHLLAGIFVHPW